MSNPQEEVDIITDFKNKIDMAGKTIQELVTLATGRAQSNNDAVTKIKELVGLLKSAIEKLVKSKNKFQDISRRIGLMNSDATTTLNARITENKKSGDSDCKKKISELLTEFNKFVEQLNGIKEAINSGAMVDLKEMGGYIEQLSQVAEDFAQAYSAIDGALPGDARSDSPRQTGTPQPMFQRRRSEVEAELGHPVSFSNDRGEGRTGRPRRSAPPVSMGGRKRRIRGGFRYGDSLKTITRKRTLSSRTKSRSKSKSKSKSRKSKSRSKSKSKSKSRRKSKRTKSRG